MFKSLGRGSPYMKRKSKRSGEPCPRSLKKIEILNLNLFF